MPLNRLPDLLLSNQTLTGVSADYLDGVTSSTFSQSLRANHNITGGGTITFDTSGNLRWSSRFIVISNGRGPHFSVDGYYEINCPTSGTITGVGGSSNKTATASGINLTGWDALYVILPIGSGNFVGNFRIAQFSADLEVPHDWLLIAVRNADNGLVYLNNGIILAPGESQNGGVKSFLRVGLSDTENYITFRGTTGDQPGDFNHTYIGERIWGGVESSELVLFKGNDNSDASGQDRIRLIAANHVFDTYTSPLSGTFSAVASSGFNATRMIIKENGSVGIGTTTPNTIAPSSTPATLGIVSNAAGTTGLIVRGAASQTASLAEWQNSAATTLVSISPSGSMRMSGSLGYVGGGGSQLVFQSGNNPAYFTATSTAGAYPSLVVRAIGSQTSNLQEWQNSSAVVLSSINTSGFFNTPRINFTGGTSTVSALALADGTLSFESTAGQLFSISNSLTGTIFSVNDISGLPIVEATDLGIVKINELFGQTVFGSGTPTASSLTTFVARTAATIPVVVKGAASQTANLQEWQTSDGTIQLRMTSIGKLFSNYLSSNYGILTGGATYAGGYNFISNPTFATTDVSLIVKAVSSQTSDLQQWQNSTGTILNTIAASGTLVIGGSTVVNSTFGITLNDKSMASWYSANNSNYYTLINFARGNTTGAWMSLGSVGDSSNGIASIAIQNTSSQTVFSVGQTGNVLAAIQSPSTVGLIVKGAASQSADYFQIQTSGGTVVVSADASNSVAVPYGQISAASGVIGSGTTRLGTAGVTAYANGAGSNGIVVRGFASQTADLQQWQNSSGTVLAEITASGSLELNGKDIELMNIMGAF